MLRGGRTNMWKEEKMDVNEANLKNVPSSFSPTWDPDTEIRTTYL